jgi:hypothetical protein
MIFTIVSISAFLPVEQWNINSVICRRISLPTSGS